MNLAALGAALRGDVANAIVASTPGGIERQEAEGQRALVAGSALPKEIHGATREQLEAIGFVFGEDLDDLFVSCQLPPGWSKRATDHSMHSDLVDDQGRVRAAIFYKAAFYDRNADMRMQARYSYTTYDRLPSEAGAARRFRTVVRDGSTVVHVVGEWSDDNYDDSSTQEATARAWLEERHADWRNPLAYW